MTLPAISVQGMGKRFQLGERTDLEKSFREALMDLFIAPIRRLKSLSGRRVDGDFWALRDVSFDLPEGQVLGIVGRNGAGKSTLLKLLSRISEPTEGRAVIRGRVASLLEVGTGFHHELSGRENIFLNGAILGMKKAEIYRKFDEIVAFSGVERFLDTPIKRYSSGMKVRLAFAVAAHLEPEILIIDEVLAVGDQEFQNKCLGKMNDVATSGRTVLFVSHNMAAVEGLCTTAIHLEKGRLVGMGETRQIITEYLQFGAQISDEVDLRQHARRSSGAVPALQKLKILVPDRQIAGQIPIGSDIIFELSVNPPKPMRYARVAIRLFNNVGLRVTTCHSEYQYDQQISIDSPTTLRCTMRNCRLAPGMYTVDLQLDEYTTMIDKIESCVALEVIPSDLYGTGRSLPVQSAVVFPEVEWRVTSEQVLTNTAS